MHSIKNTVVAVGLLGLSFLFYQFSSKKPPSQSSELVAPLAENPTADQLVIPEASPSAPTGGTSSFGSLSLTPSINSAAPPFKAASSSGSNLQLSPDLNPPAVSNKSDTPKFAPIELQPMPPSSRENLSAPEFNVTPQPSPVATPQPRNAPLDLQPLDPVSRDQGLIAQLDRQKNAMVPPPIANQNNTQPSTQPSTQPLAVSDNSFTKLAGNESVGNRDAGVVSPDRAFSPSTSVANQDFSNVSYQDAWPMVEQMVKEDRLADSLKLLSQFYHDSSLNGPQRQRLIAWLDGLAGKVIFSKEHRLEQAAFVAQGNETLEQLSQTWNVPAMLIFNVNRASLENIGGTENPIPAGTELKVIRGPFHAQIDQESHMLTLFLGDLYAGRFPVRIGIAGKPRPGEFRVVMKSVDGAASRDAEGNFHDKNSPLNSYGPFFLGLEGELCIHAATADKQDGHYGCFGLSEQDATDVFHILTTSSVIKVK